jgi:2C-methyl-D-erythritol 2,4-cyclodiphosphate synthase
VVEALNQVIKLTGVDLKSMYEDRIDEDCKKQDPEAEQIREQLEANKEAQFAVRKKKIALLAEQYKNDPVRLALLNKVAKDLKALENK